MPDRFHTGFNIEDSLWSEEPACHAEWQVAAESLIELMRNYADEDDAQALEEVDWDQMSPEREKSYFDSDDAPAMLATVASMLRDDPPVEPEDYTASVEDHQYRRVAFWLRQVMCDDPVHLGGEDE